MSLVINGRFLMQHVTGVQRVARELLAEFDQLAAAGSIPVPRLLVPGKGEMVLPPDLSVIEIERRGVLGGHAWEQLELPRLVGTRTLLCLGNTAPIIQLHLPRRPVVVMVHDLSYKYFPNAYSWKFKRLYGALTPAILRRADRVVTVSQAERAMISEHYPDLKDNPRFCYLQNGGVSDGVARAAGVADCAPQEVRTYGLYVGSLTHRKNAAGILRTAAAFLERYSEMRFVIAGATAASFEGVNLEFSQGLADRIDFLGQVDDASRIQELYRSARFLLFPSFYEASPLPPIEAMTFGCPVVASEIPSLVERCGDAALYCDPYDPASILTAVSCLMEDSLTWDLLSRKARDRAATFSWANQARGVVALCEDAK
ncbi:glycosyltransferase family 4 protein [Pseudoroseicyclus tamaricis]|uniref:Glycosyltransferase family 4 protein n=1 Tax=Pseudoroseicyclus tamaricis TaxID=2705421 RepID=A0A6B2JRP3_9RHOB|nr:glycosyltransferase family 1 protein [Pseudoroseicyclus tamaricis]NDV01247.1 glycosyltransferase family 4 protein [Pseudoroseicyclus tamaricis]